MRDFTGFKFGDWHSDNCDIIRVSGGDRYNETVHPEINDKIVEVPGMDGSHYYGSDYGPRQFEIEIAFDYLTEDQFRELRQTFGTKEMKKLVFDERPYKYYMAKLASPIELSYICFDEREKTPGASREGVRVKSRTGSTVTRETVTPYIYSNDTQRIYKGEGKISLIAYFPFAKSEYKKLPVNGRDIYYQKSSLVIPYERVEDWASSSGILSANNYNDEIDIFMTINNDKGFKVYNPGDLATGFRLYCSFGKAKALTIKYYKDHNQNGSNYDAILVIDMMTPQGLSPNIDKGIIIDTNLGLIYGVPQNPNEITNTTSTTDIKTSTNIYNQYVASGTFFKIEPHKDTTDYSKILIEASGGDSSISNNIQIFYDYLYF